MSSGENSNGCSILFHATPIHQGPLNEEDGYNFRSYTYNVVKTNSEIVIHRQYGGEAEEFGSYWTFDRADGKGSFAASRIDYAILNIWNTLEHNAELRIPPGTLLYTGPAAEWNPEHRAMRDQQKGEKEFRHGEGKQKGMKEFRHGGGEQIYLPKETISALRKYNEGGDPGDVYKAQADFVQAWERDNFHLTSSNGRALDTSAKQMSNFLDSLKENQPLPQLLKTTDAPLLRTSGTHSQTSDSVYEAPSRELRERRTETVNIVREQFRTINNIPAKQYHISAPWPGGIEMLARIPIAVTSTTAKEKFHQIAIIGSYIKISLNQAQVSVAKSQPLIITSGIEETLLDGLSSDEVDGLYEACKQSTRHGVVISLELHDDHMETLVNGIDVEKYPEIFKTLKEADVLLGSFIFGTNLFESSQTGGCSEYTKSRVQSYKNPINQHTELLSKSDETGTKMREDVCNFSQILPHSKFVINSKARIVFRKKNDEFEISCTGCPLDINLRGIYIDHYGNIYWDDEATRCYAIREFIKDFRSNYTHYLREYPILRRLAAYAIFVGLFQNSSADENEVVFYRKYFFSEKRLSEGSSEELKAFEVKALKLREEIIRENSWDSPYVLVSLGSLWSAHDSRMAVKFYMEALLNMNKADMPNKGQWIENVDNGLLKSKLILDACTGLLCHKTLETDVFTRNEKILFQKILSLESVEKSDQIVLGLVDVILRKSMTYECWDQVMSILWFLSNYLNKAVTDTPNNTELPSMNDCWGVVMTRDWRLEPNNRKAFVSLISNCSRDFLNEEEIEDASAKVFYNSLIKYFETPKNAFSKLIAIFKKQPLFDGNDEETRLMEALGCQMIPFYWQQLSSTKNLPTERFIKEFYRQTSFFIRSLSALIQLVEAEPKKIEWLVIARGCITHFHRFAELGNSKTQRLKAETENVKLEKFIRSIGQPISLLSFNHSEAIIRQASEVWRLAELAKDHQMAARVAQIISKMHEIRNDAFTAQLWAETAEFETLKSSP